MEDLKWLAEKLPEKMDGPLQEMVHQTIYDEGHLGENIILYHRESVVVTPRLERLMDDAAIERYKRGVHRTWGAMCTCSNCGEDFFTGYINGSKPYIQSGIVLMEGEDGLTYPDAYDINEAGAVGYRDGETVLCPLCSTHGTLTRRKDLRHGRTYQTLQTELRVVEGYAVILYWLISRVQDDRGCDFALGRPRDALVIDKDGRLQRFAHTTCGQFGERHEEHWRWSGRVRDPEQIRYYCYGAANNRCIGGWSEQWDYPDLTGTTGEKTAVDEYLRAGGTWPGVYLQTWRKHPQIENLVRGGFDGAVVRAIEEEVDNAHAYCMLRETASLGWVDWREVKPHRMLHMDKVGYRAARDARWGLDTLKGWELYRSRGAGAGAEEYGELVRKVGVKEIRALLEMQQAGWNGFEVRRVVRYLEKQGQLQGGVQHLIDYRKTLHEAGMAETEETLWPRNLIEAHDRMTAWKVAHEKEFYQKDFTETAKKYAALEWTDGELCIRLPRIEEELKREGKVLRHCVGGYGHSHISGKPIFFVRKYRRPERSYYTLNINMTTTLPQEIQLHGYGNEHHGDRKQYTHKIPKKVRDFVDRWEQEVLLPWFKAQKAMEAAELHLKAGKPKKKKKGKKKAA